VLIEVGERLTLVFERDTLKAEGALLRIQSRLSGLGSPSNGFRLDGKPIDNVLLVTWLRKPHFNLVGNGYEFDFGKVRNSDLDFLLIKSVYKEAWDKWAAPFLEMSGFTMAWVSDIAYEFWQNADDPLQYRARNKSFEGLPTNLTDCRIH
jgi:hypothetical protein